MLLYLQQSVPTRYNLCSNFGQTYANIFQREEGKRKDFPTSAPPVHAAGASQVVLLFLRCALRGQLERHPTLGVLAGSAKRAKLVELDTIRNLHH